MELYAFKKQGKHNPVKLVVMPVEEEVLSVLQVKNCMKCRNWQFFAGYVVEVKGPISNPCAMK